MSIERALRLLTGIMVLLGTGLTVLVSPWWALLLVAVAVNNAQSAFSDTCPAVTVLEKMGLKRCDAA